MTKLFIVLLIVLVLLWLLTLPARRRRADPENRRRKMHNSGKIGYRGFPVSEHPDGGRKVHAAQRDGAHNCSDQCPYCARGQKYQAEQLVVFDDRLIRGARSRRRMRNGG